MNRVDAHVHVLRDAATPEAFRAALRQAGTVRAVLCGTSPLDWPFVQAAQGDGVVPFFGVHPWWCEREISGWEIELETFLAANPQAGVGEIGLDACRRSLQNRLADVRQETVFRRQLEMAQAWKRPATIHCVHAWGRLLPILRTIWGTSRLPLLFHAFSGSPEIAREVLRFPAAFGSFAPFQYRSNAARFSQRIRSFPFDRILLETDADTQAALEEGDAFYAEVAAILGISLSDWIRQTTENWERFLAFVVD